MSVQRALDLQVEVRANTDLPFVLLAGLRATHFALSANPLDAASRTGLERWQNLLAQSGSRHAHIEGEGVFASTLADNLLEEIFFTGQHADCRIAVPAFGVISGFFALTELIYRGQDNDALLWQMVLRSAGPITFRPKS